MLVLLENSNFGRPLSEIPATFTAASWCEEKMRPFSLSNIVNRTLPSETCIN